MGPILRASHTALAFVWAVLWAAGLDQALRAAGEPAVAASPLAGAAAVFAMIALGFRERIGARRAPGALPRAQGGQGSPAPS
jgi:hypothetical protein